MNYTSQFPPAQNSTYVKVSNESSPNMLGVNCTDPTKNYFGGSRGWQTDGPQACRIHIDLGVAKIIRRLKYENLIDGNYGSNYSEWVKDGAQGFTLWGSNDATAFSTLTYATDTNWVQLTTSQATFDRHVELSQQDTKFITVTNIVPYRYHAVKISGNYGGIYSTGLLGVELQTEDGFGETGGYFHMSV